MQAIHRKTLLQFCLVIAICCLSSLLAGGQSSFTPISTPTSSYVGSTDLLPITVPDFTLLSSLSNSKQTVTFSTSMDARTVPNSWATWNSPPNTESSTPRVLYTNGATSVTITLSQPSTQFGLETEPNPFQVHAITAVFMNGSTVLVTVSRPVNGFSGALLAAASTNQPITSVQVFSDVDFAIAQLRSGQTLQIEATLLTPSKPAETTGATGNPQAHVPLGSKFQLRLVQPSSGGSTPTGIDSKFDLGAPSFQGTLSSNSVFPNNVIFSYAQPGKDTGSFQAVHLGSQAVTITPADTSISPVTLTVVVEQPASLGIRHPEVDSLVYPIADRKGILPEYVKGQMDQESGSRFNPTAYRYEPLSPWVGDFGVISRNQNLRTQADSYSHYRLATQADCLNAALPAGDLLINDDITPRQTYLICPAGQCRNITAADQFVTALDIINANPRQNWQTANRRNYNTVENAAARGDTCTSVWTAQTALASSYGYFQVMYVTATDLHWAGADGARKNPSLLFDTAANLAIHGGSVELGTDIIERAVVRIDPGDSANPQFNAESDLQDFFKDGWATYNARPTYPDDVLAKTKLYPPQPARSIFGGTQ
jgi:hypothetical protein